MEEEDPYTVLQVKRTADLTEIRKSYQRLARQCHPDKLEDGVSEVERSAAVHTFHRITKAYKLLSNPELREAFDVKSSAEQLTQKWPISDTVDLDCMEYEAERGGAYSAPCRCGGSYTITEDDLEGGVDVVCCSTCTLGIRVLYHMAAESGDEKEEV